MQPTPAPAISENRALLLRVAPQCTNWLSAAKLLYQFCGLLSAGAALAANISGEWEFSSKYLGDVSYARVTLKVDAGKLSGNLNELKLEGTVKDNAVVFNAKRPNGDDFGNFTGAASGDKLEGTATWSGDRNVTWSAKRAAMPPSKPRVHDFEPTEFHRVFS